LPVGEIATALRHDGHPPLFYYLLHYWAAIFGDSDWSVRAMSGVFSVLTLPLLYLAGTRVAERSDAERLGRHRTGLLVMAVGAAMPFAIRYGSEARMYAIVSFLSAIGYLLVDELLSARRNGSARAITALAAAIVTAALLWTHYWSMWLLAAVGMLALWRTWRETDPERRAGARYLLGALVAGGILFIPWLSALLYQSSHTGTPWGESYGPASVLVITILDFAGGRFGAAQLLTYLLVPLILIALFVAIESRTDSEEMVIQTVPNPRIRTEIAIFILTLAIGWAAAAVSGNTFSSRYSSVVFPLFVIVVGAGLAVFRQRFVTLGLLVTLLAMCFFGAVGAARSDRSQNGELAKAIVADASTSDTPSVVISCPDQLGVSLQRELEHQAPKTLGGQSVLPYPGGGSPNLINWVDYGDRNEASSPEEFLKKFQDRIPDDATVYLVASTQYRTFEGKCEGLIGLLGQGRAVTNAVALNTEGLDEAAGLWIFKPTS
ncbi:MAG TPA: glycosyltransferase family 39 protein, partial [Microthrixaceae bacterium]|nr:glycosyltransferase family 39 protein [Microthrixaceae bacterium]